MYKQYLFLFLLICSVVCKVLHSKPKSTFLAQSQTLSFNLLDNEQPVKEESEERKKESEADEGKEIVFEIPLNEAKKYIVQTLVGTPASTYPLLLETTSSSTWLPSAKCATCKSTNKYDQYASKSMTELSSTEGVLNEEGSVEGEVISDTIQIGNIKIPNYNFISVLEMDKKRVDDDDGIIGLGRPNKDKVSKSLISELKANRLINDEKFALDLTDTNKAKLIFGNTNKYIDKAAPFCSLIPRNFLSDTYKESWVCGMKFVKVVDTLIKVETFVNFDSAVEYIYVPYEYIPVFDKEVFTKMYKNKCRLVNDNWEFTFKCKVDSTFEGNFEFVLDNIGFKVAFEDLFVKVNDEYQFLIRFRKNENMMWNLGHAFLKHFIAAFDAESEKVYLSGDYVDYSNVISDFNEKTDTNKFWIKLALFLAAFGIIVLLSLFCVCLCVKGKTEANSLVKNEEEPQS